MYPNVPMQDPARAQEGLFASADRPSPCGLICFVFPSTSCFKLKFSFMSRKSNSFGSMLTSGADTEGIAGPLALSCAAGYDTNVPCWLCTDGTTGQAATEKTKHPPMHRDPTKQTIFILNTSQNAAINDSTFFCPFTPMLHNLKSKKTPSSIWIYYIGQNMRQISWLYFKYSIYNLQ